MQRRLNPIVFYVLSFTWGLPMTLVGALTYLILRLSGKKPHRLGPCRFFCVGQDWGGLEMGAFFLTDKRPSPRILCHEAGHSIQNILFGPFMPLLVSIPSAIRYWYREIRRRMGKPSKKPYDSIWFERQATELGFRYFAGFLPSPGK